MTTDPDLVQRTEISIKRARPDLPGKWAVGFTRGNNTSIEHLTQGELLDLWQQIGILFNLAGMRDAARQQEPSLTGNPDQEARR